MEINGIIVSVVRKKVKRINLRILVPSGEVKLSAPLKTSDKKIKKYIISQQVWIQKNINKARGIKEVLPENKIEINGITAFVVRKKIKNINLRILPPNGTVKISAPLRASDSSIKKFILSKQAWLEKHIKTIQEQPKQSKEYLSGDLIEFKGKQYTLKLIEKTGRAKIEIINDEFILHIKQNATVLEKEKTILSWYRKELEKELPDLFKKWENIIGKKAKEVRIKKMKTRWGTCNTKDKRIWINLELIRKPSLSLEYVILHELVHFYEKSHNAKFKNLMTKFMPNWKENKKALSYGLG